MDLVFEKCDEPVKWYKVTKGFSDEHANALLEYFPEPIKSEYTGKRDGANDFRVFVTRKTSPELAELFSYYNTNQSRDYFSNITGVDCSEGHLRIELCQDSPGFWLEPHCDIPEKLITLQIYLDTGKQDWGTSIYNKSQDIYCTIPFVHNTGWLTNANSKCIHGVQKNKVDGIRKSVIINYVFGAWRDKDQLY